MNHKQKQQKIKTFHELYYSESDSFKQRMLPYWIEKYGNILKQEDLGNIPRTFNRYVQGTVVMVDFGVRLGSEMSGAHFAAVVSKHDSKYNGNVTVVPLSSKAHKLYVGLGNELFANALQILEDHKLEFEEGRQKFEKWQEKQNPFTTDFFNSQLMEAEHNISPNLDSSFGKLLKNFGAFADNPKGVLEQVTNFEKELASQEKNEYTNVIDDTVSKLREIAEYYLEQKTVLDDFGQALDNQKRTISQLEKYNKSTFADTKNITTVSKLRIQRYNKFDISANVTLSQSSINKIVESVKSSIE